MSDLPTHGALSSFGIYIIIMKLLLLIGSCLFGFTSIGQQYWGRNTESSFTNEAVDIEVDSYGNSYICGYITGETAFNTNVSEPYAQGNGDIYVAKYSSNGSLVWIKRYGGSYSDRAYDLFIDQNDDILVTGQFFGSVDFDGNIITSTQNSKDIFLIKMNSTGDVLWAISEGGSGSENAYGITTDSQNNVILTGQFQGNSIIGGQSLVSMTDPILNAPSYDLFVSKYNSSGVNQWIITGQAEYEDRGLAVYTDDQNNIFLTGQFSDTIVFAGQTINNGSYNVGFLAKLNTSGNLLWLNPIKAAMVMAYDLEVNDVNEVVVIGDFLGNLIYQDPGINTITNPFTRQIFAFKTDNDGNYIWGTSLGSENKLSARSVSIDNTKDIYITGHFECDWDELQTHQGIFNSVGFEDPYLWKIDNSGQSDYVKHFGGQRDDFGHGVALINGIKPVVCGSYMRDLNIPANSGTTYSTAYGNFTLNSNSLSEPNHIYLYGDESANSFLTTALGSFTPEYNYFFNQPTDSLFGEIWPIGDTVHLCPPDSLWYQPYTYKHFGPDYTYLWNTGDTTQGEPANFTGYYEVDVERLDGCSSGYDSSYVIYHNPPLPILHDEYGNEYYGPGYNIFHLCDPDTIDLWFTDVCTGCDLTISGGIFSYNDSLTHPYYTDDDFLVSISDGFCANYGSFEVILDYILPYDIEPYMVLVDQLDQNDSILICPNSSASFNILDYLENADSTYGLFPNDPVAYFDWNISGPGVSWIIEDTFDLSASITTTGWYNVSWTGAVGYDNECGLDTTLYTLSQSYYIEVAPSQTAVITGSNLLCPGGSVYLITNNVIPGLSWSGPAVEWVSSGGDSVQVSASGVYHYSGSMVDTINNCITPLDFQFYLQEKAPPSIYSNPSDAIVCPNDSVHMWTESYYTSYTWTGPEGDSLSLTYDHIDDDQGFYYVTVVDTEGCVLTSLPLEIREYVTPYIFVEPDNVLCQGETATIYAVIEGSGTINWLPPLSGSNESVTVSQAGWYYCEMQHCGITTLDSVYIIDGSFSISLTVSDSIICYGEQAMISATPGLGSYEWSTGDVGVNTIIVEEDVTVYLEAMNGYGCEAVSDTVTIDFIENSEPPNISDVSVCYGDDVTISNPAGNINEWYASDTSWISSGTSITLYAPMSDTLILAAYNVPQCETYYDEIVVTVIDTLPDYYIIGPLEMCPSSSAIYHIDIQNNENIEWFIDSISVGLSDSIQIETYQIEVDSTVTVVVSNSCFVDTISINVIPLTPDSVQIAEDTIINCYGDDLSITIDSNYSEVEWNGAFGTSIGTDLYLANGTTSGYIFVSAIDINGCPTNTDSVLILASEPDLLIKYLPETNCFGQDVTLGVETAADSVVWTTPVGDSAQSWMQFYLNNQLEGVYYVTVTDSLGCSYSDSIEITVDPLPSVDYPNDTIICLREYIGGGLILDSGMVIWDWYNQNDSIMITVDGYYAYTLVDSNDCEFYDSIYVDVVNCDDELPNIITPNGDGINDYFVIDEAPLYPNNHFMILNRWGNVIYEEYGYLNSFAGADINDGTYFYVFYYDEREMPEKVVTGHLTITR